MGEREPVLHTRASVCKDIRETGCCSCSSMVCQVLRVASAQVSREHAWAMTTYHFSSSDEIPGIETELEFPSHVCYLSLPSTFLPYFEY